MAIEVFNPAPLRRERLRRGWSQTEAADRARIPRSTWGSVERGEQTPSAPLLLAMARALEMRGVVRALHPFRGSE